MEIRVLGPVEVDAAGGPVRLARRQQRLVLGILALRANRPVPADRLIALLWDDAPPPKARAVLQTRVSELRARLQAADRDGATRLVTRAGGYALHTGPGTVDADRFRALLSQAHAAPTDQDRRGLLREALRLWRGPVLGGGLAPQAAALGQELESLRLTAIEDRFEAELRLGNHLGVVDEVRDLAATHRARERLLELSLLALYRCDRTAEALREYDRHRRWLRRELGIDPPARVRALYLRMLDESGPRASGPAGTVRVIEPAQPAERLGPTQPNQRLRPTPPGERIEPAEPGEARQRGAPCTLPLDIADFTGREAEIAALRALLATGDGGTGAVAVVAVVGQAGVGKTALAVHAAHLVRDGFPDGQLYVDLKGWSDAEPAAPRTVLGAFLRALGVDDADVPDPLDERAALFRALLADRRALVVLDNAASGAQVLPLIPAGARCGVLITARTRLGASLGARTLSLDVMDGAAAARLLRRVWRGAREDGPRGDDRVEALCRQCGYLPLALRVAGATLAAKPHWNAGKLVESLRRERGRLDRFVYGHHDVRASIALSWAGLSRDARWLGCLIGGLDLGEVSVWAASALLDGSPERAEDALEELFDAQLLGVVGTDTAGRGRYRAHDLVRRFGGERARAEYRQAEVDTARDRLFGAWVYLTGVAHHAVHGRAGVAIEGAGACHVLDARLAAPVRDNPLAWFEAEHHLIPAMVREAARAGRTGHCWQLASLATILCHTLRHFDESQATLEFALRALDGSSERRGRAALLYCLGITNATRTRYEEGMACYRRAARILAGLGDRHAWALVMAMRAVCERYQQDYHAARTHYDQALRVLREHGDAGMAAFVLRGLGQIDLLCDELDAAEERFAVAMRGMRDSGWRQGEGTVLCWRARLRVEQGRYAEAVADLDEAMAICRAMDDRSGMVQCLNVLGQCHLRQGDRDRARRALRGALDLAGTSVSTQVETEVARSMAAL